ncbi:MAG: helix-turn-helix transcriptional regulator [Spirochaetaceae bacterium]|nr:helix-turn-helix transcriptional regulator [Spirochaetaceae bacterium]
MDDNAAAGLDQVHQTLTQREIDVLERLERYRDKEIAWDLKLSYDGVRFRVRSIFAKLGARGRLDAVHRARARGILPPADDAAATDS